MAGRMRLPVAISRFVPFIGYHHVLMIIVAIAIILLSLLLAGCTSSSSGIPGIFLISFYYNDYVPLYSSSQVNPAVASKIATIVGNAKMVVRVGYWGTCVAPDGVDFICSSNSTLLSQQVTIDEDPLNLIWVAQTFKNSVVFPYLIIIALVLAFIAFLMLATFPGWATSIREDGSDIESVDVKRFPSPFVSQVALALLFIAAIFLLVSVLWQHTASVAAAQVAQDFGNGSVRSGVGLSAMVLGWFGFALIVLVAIGLLVMIISMRVLDTLTG